MKNAWPKEMTKSINSVFQTQVKKYGNRTMLMEKFNGIYQSKSWLEVSEEVTKLSQGLNSLGVKPGDRVALMMTTQANWAISDLAILSAAAINVPIYPTNKGPQIAHILNDSAAEIIIVGSQSILQEVLSIWPNAPNLRIIIAPNGTKSALDNFLVSPLLEGQQVLEWNHIQTIGGEFHRQQPDLFTQRCSMVEAHHMASILYTSGTTGNPKGVMLTHNNFLSNVRAGLEKVPVNDSYVNLSFLPLSHVLERTAGYYLSLVAGMTMAYAEDVTTVPENMMEIKPHTMTSVPRLYEKIYDKIMESVNAGSWLKKQFFYWAKNLGRENAVLFAEKKQPNLFFKLKFALADKLVFKKIRDRFGGRLEFCISGGAPLGKELAEFFNGIGVCILEGYGLTETSPIISYNCPEAIRYGSVGQPLPGGEVKIADDGEILSRGPQNCLGYYNNPEATKELFDQEGWLRTGDIGYLDKDNFLFITDRKKDLIITSGGKNIPPQTVESLLVSDRYIAQAIIYGDKRNYLVAMLVPNYEHLQIYAKEKGISFSNATELVDHSHIKKILAKRVAKSLKDLPSFEQVKRFYIKNTEFTMEANELTPTLKIRRRFIYKKYADIWDGLYTGKVELMEVIYKHKTAK